MAPPNYGSITNVCVIGGSGFVGGAIVRRLAEHQIRVIVPTRNRERAKHLIVLPTVEVVKANVHDANDLNAAIAGVDAVVNLVGILHESRAGDFQRVHVELPRRIAAGCKKAGVRRLLQMSALRADRAAPSEYLRTKAEGEAAVREAAKSEAASRADEGLAVSIFRPSVIFGPGDRFLNVFVALARRLPFIVLVCPDARFQPVYVEDVARAFVESLFRPESAGQSYDLCGPNVYTLRELVQFAATATGHRRRILGLNDRLSYLLAGVLERVPGKPMTRDNYRSMQLDNVCDRVFPFGIDPAHLEAIATEYLAAPKSAYQNFRSAAGR